MWNCGNIRKFWEISIFITQANCEFVESDNDYETPGWSEDTAQSFSTNTQIFQNMNTYYDRPAWSEDTTQSFSTNPQFFQNMNTYYDRL